jgi:hypothetical protein
MKVLDTSVEIFLIVISLFLLVGAANVNAIISPIISYDSDSGLENQNTSSPGPGIEDTSNISQSSLVQPSFSTAQSSLQLCTLDGVQNEGCVTVTKVVTDPNNLVDDSIEANLQFLIQIKNGDGTVRDSELYTDGESNTIRLNAGETFTVEESNGPPPNGVTFDQTSEGECTGTIVSERNHNCVITNRITGTDQNAIPIAPEKELESSPGNIGSEEISSTTAEASPTSGLGALSNLTVFTTVENNCEPKSACERITSSDFENQIFQFQDWKESPLTLVKSFPGSATGWTTAISSDSPPPMQYEVKASPDIVLPGLANITYSPDCQGSTDEDHVTCNINIRTSSITKEIQSANLTGIK